ncbi:MAG: alanine racemase, partial [Schwartzia sp.]|nr:alanine racemase [Schwartzia sp. (in: firmicutes)]
MGNRVVWAEVDLSALRQNLKIIRSHIAGDAKLCAVVKADAYGHGAVAVAGEAVRQGADYLAVAVLSEAVALREAGITTPILLLGPSQAAEADEVVHYGVTAAAFTPEQGQALSAAAERQKRPVKVHLAVDTGMGRIGVRPEAAGDMARTLASLPGIEVEGVFSHFALADAHDKSYAKEQFRRFQTALADMEDRGIRPAIRHIANSAAILEMPETHLDMVRAGIILYGLVPSEEVGPGYGFRPLLRLRARVTYVKDLYPGEAVGYGCTFRAKRQTRLATLPIGYADGYTRLYAGKASVEIRGRRAPIVGRICMDQCMADVTDIPGVVVGDK